MLLRSAFAVLLLGFSLVRAETTPPAVLFGKVMRDTYVAPGGVYQVPLPVLPEFGGKVHDTETVVTFDDDLNTHISIACFPLENAQKWEIEIHGLKEYLAFFYTNYVLADFQQRFPGSKAEATAFVPNLLEGSLLGFALLPGGSFFAGKNNMLPAAAAAPDPAVAKRGNLIFVRAGRLYVVSIELAERITQRAEFRKTPQQENDILRERLVTFASRIRFPSPAMPAQQAGG